MSIGERIILLRKEQHINQSQLAKMLDVSRQAVSKWENDLAAPDTIRLIQLADALNTDVEYLATGKKTPVKTTTAVVYRDRPVEVLVEKAVEKVVEKPVYIEKKIEVPQYIEKIVEKPVAKKIMRTKYIRNPLEFVVVGAVCFLIGLLIGFLF